MMHVLFYSPHLDNINAILYLLIKVICLLVESCREMIGA